MTTDQSAAQGGERLTNIYVIGAPGHRPVKIGKANDVQSRLRTLQTASPYRLEVRLAVQAPAVLETDLHAYFAKFRTKGEWFDFGQRDPVFEVCEGLIGLSQGKTAGPDGPRRITSFDHLALASHPEYYAASRAIDAFAKKDLGGITRTQWLDAVRAMAEALTYSDLCKQCTKAGTYDSLMPPISVRVEGDRVHGLFYCMTCGNRWQMWYSTEIEDWT